METYLFILNPISGGIDKADFKQTLKMLCKEKYIDYNIFETTGENDLEKIRAELSSKSITVVVACGGDGTINLTVEAIIGNDIKLGIVPLGSANGLAQELEIFGGLDECLKIITEGKSMEMDVLLIQDKFLSLHLSDIGFNARMIKSFEKSGMRGKLSYAYHLIKELGKKEVFTAELKVNGQNLIKTLEMLIFANSRKYGSGAVVNPDGRMDDGKFEVCMFKPYPRQNILKLTYLFFTGKLKQSNYIDIISTDEIFVKIQNPEILQIDGEVKKEYDRVHVKIHPNKINILIP